ncbi:MAG TPA: wax ester/triacylglycerol synthase family O-acyltransferase [Candidatus Acidoferrales bacterium]|nr:wax ester/triacylglycerol synthase family O-acyltransferase [Candidatus Acidoferrales bacterium]
MNPASPVSRRLSEIDAAFLYLERREIPLAIAGVFLFDGPVPFDAFVAAIDSKLHLIPRYRQVVIPPPFHLGHPTWQDYPRFDILQHIHRVALPAPGGDAELEALAGRLFSQVMDRNRPLWEIYVIEGVSGRRGALIARVHHALADGIAGAALLKIMFDATPEGSHAIPKPPVRVSPAPLEHSIVEAVSSAIHSSLKSMLAAEAALLDFGQALLTERMQTGLQGFLKLLPEWAKPVERLPFNRPCGGERKFCWAEIDFADLKAIRERLGGTVNDVILAIVTRAVARYTKFHGHPVTDRFVRIICPVNVRQEDQQSSLGNRITFLPVVLPMGVDDPTELLHAVSARMEIMKSVRAAELLAIAGAWIGATPPPVQALFWEGLPLLPLPLPLFNLICTNIPGSPTPLYSVGRRMTASYPQVPTGHELGIGVAVQSYDGRMFFGLTADAGAASDVTRFRDYIRSAFRDLFRAAGLKRSRKLPARLAATAD